MTKRVTDVSRSACDPIAGASLETYGEIVQHYISVKRPVVNRDRAFFKRLSLEDAIRFAALAKRPDGKRRDHQRRLKGTVLMECEQQLQQRRDQIQASTTFSQLHDMIESEIRGIRGVGPLTVYDIAHNIGARLGLEPEEIYLHAGTKTGAKLLGVAARQKRLEKSDLPQEFRRLKPRELEDCLCSYASHIASARSHLL